jgi:hypothetical protein
MVQAANWFTRDSPDHSEPAAFSSVGLYLLRSVLTRLGAIPSVFNRANFHVGARMWSQVLAGRHQQVLVRVSLFRQEFLPSGGVHLSILVLTASPQCALDRADKGLFC